LIETHSLRRCFGDLVAVSGLSLTTYQVDAIRSLMVEGGRSVCGLAADWGILL
jgi:hypothetical protein